MTPDETIFTQSKDLWKQLLRNRSLDELYTIDFPHVLKSASVEKFKLICDFVYKKYPTHHENLVQQITNEVLDQPQWTSSKVQRAAEFLTPKYYWLKDEIDDQHDMLERFVMHPKWTNKKDASFDVIFRLAIVRESELLQKLLSTLSVQEREQKIRSTILEYKHNINMIPKTETSIIKPFFSKHTTAILPEFSDAIVEHVCKNLKHQWDRSDNGPFFNKGYISFLSRFAQTHDKVMLETHKDAFLTAFAAIPTDYNLSELAPFLHTQLLQQQLGAVVEKIQMEKGTAHASQRKI